MAAETIEFGRFYVHTYNLCLWKRVKVMRYFPQRLMGMLKLRGCNRQTAYWFPCCRSIHTWGMSFAIDVVALDREQKIVGVYRNIQPGQFLRCPEAYSIVECEAGCQLPLEIWFGEQLRFELINVDEEEICE